MKYCPICEEPFNDAERPYVDPTKVVFQGKVQLVHFECYEEQSRMHAIAPSLVEAIELA